MRGLLAALILVCVWSAPAATRHPNGLQNNPLVLAQTICRNGTCGHA